MSISNLPIWKAADLSFGAKMTWISFHIGIPVAENVWRKYLAAMGQPYVSRKNCVYELEAAGWM